MMRVTSNEWKEFGVGKLLEISPLQISLRLQIGHREDCDGD